MQPVCYTAIHTREEVWKQSSSGGAFSAITDQWFAQHPDNASVYGCVLDECGFFYPVIDEARCIKCKLCLKVCSFDSTSTTDGE